MVRVYLNLVHSCLAVASPMFEGVHDCEEFLVVDLIVNFRRLEFL